MGQFGSYCNQMDTKRENDKNEWSFCQSNQGYYTNSMMGVVTIKDDGQKQSRSQRERDG